MLFSLWSVNSTYKLDVFPDETEKEEVHFPSRKNMESIDSLTDGKMELFLDAETYVMDEKEKIMEQVLRNYEFLKAFYGHMFWKAFYDSSLYIEHSRLTRFGDRFKPDFQTYFKSDFKTDFATFTESLFPQIRFFSITSEVRDKMRENEYLRMIIDKALIEIRDLPQLSSENYLVHASLERDIEVPDWEEIVVSIRIEERNFDEKMKLWEIIEQKIRSRIEVIRSQCVNDEQRQIIDEINQDLSVEIIESTF